ncbi:hypothetical protein PMSM_27140 [Paenibacillus macquariensis subsp. macquariensis]|uniref:DUF4825 domain-containing protein n=2 Tax=Paenibacillus macquariensis TaxID=948756 RepID=A0ABY1KF63_9BACL|nr:hypothetical protein [Paenibacillus macquariensis]OAB26245.1 hypothetical protein PMSM_27140 [Paenibacillus macquariensis subsp. macquariensis]SIR74920.1 hypothetical protein SAMN05421578_1643 [Paenibacillus macquariensis]
MKKKNWIIVILAVSLFGNVALFMNHKIVIRNQELRYEFLNAYIHGDLAQLEATIQDQLDNNWGNETLVTQKLDDAIDSINLHIVIEIDDDKRDILRKLENYMYKFKVGDGTLDVSLNDKQRADYIYLGQKLRSNGWTFEVGYDKSWDFFSSKVKEFVAE